LFSKTNLKEAEQRAKDAPEPVDRIENIQMVRPKKVSAAIKHAGFSFCFQKLILDGPEQAAMEVDSEPLGGDGGFFGDDGGFGFGDGDGDLYDSDEDNIVEDDTLTADSMYLNHFKYTDLRIVSKPRPSQQSSPLVPTTSPSLDTGLASPSTKAHSTPTPPTPTTQLVTPPITPPKSRQKSPSTKKSAKSTPTRVGKLIHRLEEIGFVPDEVTLLGEAMVGGEGVAVESLAKAYKDYVASDPKIKDVNDKLAGKHVKRMLHAANYIVLSAPIGLAFATQQYELLSLLFAHTPEYVSLLSWLITGKSVKSQSPTDNL
jgi:hypothetical protein